MNSQNTRPFFDVAKVQSLVLILDGNSEPVAHTSRKIGV